MSKKVNQKDLKCPCGRPIAEEEECKEAHDANRCKVCYQVEQYALIIKARKNVPLNNLENEEKQC